MIVSSRQNKQLYHVYTQGWFAKPTVCAHTEEVAYFSFTMTMVQINTTKPMFKQFY